MAVERIRSAIRSNTFSSVTVNVPWLLEQLAPVVASKPRLVPKEQLAPTRGFEAKADSEA